MLRKPVQLTVVSGKGGTGKTTVVGSFAVLAQNKVLADCDVDAANLHLLLQPELTEKCDFYGARVAVRDAERCISCGACETACRFEAITEDAVNTLSCEGCGYCVLVCPADALSLETVKNGEYYMSRTKYGLLAHARLLPGAESSGRLVTVVRKEAEDIALSGKYSLILIDGPPGIGCTATAALTDVDLALIVTEPTLSGIHDMLRIEQLIRHFNIPVAVLINKADVNPKNTRQIWNICQNSGIPIVGEIPFDSDATHAIAAGKPLVEFSSGPAAASIVSAWKKMLPLLHTP